jgi:ubiquinone/menaquinone biosynthesis C-methylase UbiE
MTSSTSPHIDYIPPLHINRLTVFYDLFMRLLMRDAKIKAKLIDDASIEDGQRILDLGCGTGTLMLMIKRKYSDVDLIGLDIDSESLRLALRKSYKAKSSIALVKGSAIQLPYASETFDRVLSSLVYHHLRSDQKVSSMQEVLRVLKPKGQFLLADFGKPGNFIMSMMSRVLGKIEDVSDNVQGLMPVMMKQAGFSDVSELETFFTPFGTLAFYRGKKPK